ncbi:MAG: hypothetical protein JSR83_01205 [Proteobacteria bacterium]|nr:hypothetical protein [Pseudomonadota bacterium]
MSRVNDDAQFFLATVLPDNTAGRLFFKISGHAKRKLTQQKKPRHPIEAASQPD